MIFDWYNGGDWGGLPVRRVGHIMADFVNASWVLYDYMRTPGSYTAPSYQKGDGTAISFATEPNALASWWDGLPVGSEIISHNFAEAFNFLEGLTDNRALTASQFVADDYESDLTLADLGIDDLDAASLTRVQQGAVWGRVRDAFERVRYLRRPMDILQNAPGIFTSVEHTGGTRARMAGIDNYPDSWVLSPAENTIRVNAALVGAWAGIHDAGTADGFLLCACIGGYVLNSGGFGTAGVGITDRYSPTFQARVETPQNTNDNRLDLPVMRSVLKFASLAGLTDTIGTSEGSVSDGTELEFGYSVEEVEFTDVENDTQTAPYYFADDTIEDPLITYDSGGAYRPHTDTHIVYDINNEAYSS
jgi:hypothetical protein